jgi:hypothetical protein
VLEELRREAAILFPGNEEEAAGLLDGYLAAAMATEA